MMNDIQVLQIHDVEVLMQWRMEVLRCVFSIPTDADTTSLEQANRHYYERHLPDGSHIACIASVNGEMAGSGGVCFQEEMPSSDNPLRPLRLSDEHLRPSRLSGAWSGTAHRPLAGGAGVGTRHFQNLP